jgi:3-oxoacyl-[acyl-carrier protein] reductase
MSSAHNEGTSQASALVFGASGAIGWEICTRLLRDGVKVFGASRSVVNADKALSVAPLQWSLDQPFVRAQFDDVKKFNAVIWAQGANCNDSIYDFDRRRHEEIYQANVVYILESLRQLLELDLVSPGSRLCVISSIWQEIARQNKLSYTVTKAALRGLVSSLAIDLGARNILVNAVLPGALDTPMTRANLSSDQIAKIEEGTPLKSLPTFEDVSELVAFLCSEKNTGLTGQFIAADRGYSFVRFI